MFLLLVFVVCASISDLLSKKIPNWLNAGFFFIGLLSGFNLFSAAAIVFSLSLYYFRVWGGGDSKFFIALSLLSVNWLSAFLLSGLLVVLFFRIDFAKIKFLFFELVFLKRFNSLDKVICNKIVFAPFLGVAFIVIECLSVVK
ncbi:prepilin peptidase [Candidatus Micrarchaeota archaeon]|nr:prepilin peptidase [Candidatus Micrarchaeota archaeon]